MLSKMNSRYSNVEEILKELIYMMDRFITYKINFATEQVKISIEVVYPPCNDRRLVTKVFNYDDILSWANGVDDPKEFCLRFKTCWDNKGKCKE